MEGDFTFPEPYDDFSLLTVDELRSIKTNHIELKSVRKSRMVAWSSIPGYPLDECFFFVIGYSSNSRFLLIALNYDVDGDRLIYHQVKLANEDDIKGLWCG